MRAATKCAAAAEASAGAGAGTAAGGAAGAAPGLQLPPGLVDGLAVVVGYCVMLGACFRSVPQLLKIWRNQSVTGLSITTNVAELWCYTVILAYNWTLAYPFSTYGETFLLWVQDVLLVLMILRFNGMGWPLLALLTVLCLAGCVWLGLGLCPMPALVAMQASTIVILPLLGRLPQILLNVQRGDAGMLSTATCLLNVAGNVARIFTTVVLTQDALLLVSCYTQLVFNSILLYQSARTDRLRARGLLADEDPGAQPKPAPAT